MAIESILRAAAPQSRCSSTALFDRCRMEQPNRVHRPLLAEPIDTADALLEPERIPRQLDVDHEPAAMMQVESFAGGIGRDEDVDAAVVERVHRRSPLFGRHAAVDEADAPRRRRQGGERWRRACRDTP